ncbi:MAG: hypothetical protein ACRDGD_11730 [Candidatus Limnocylindria bacterium]
MTTTRGIRGIQDAHAWLDLPPAAGLERELGLEVERSTMVSVSSSAW